MRSNLTNQSMSELFFRVRRRWLGCTEVGGLPGMVQGTWLEDGEFVEVCGYHDERNEKFTS